MTFKTLLGLLFMATLGAVAKADLLSVAGPGTFDSSTSLISEINFSDDQLIVDMRIEVSGLEYKWAGDLTLTVTSPIGTTFNLVQRIGKSDFSSDVDSGNSSDFGGNYIFTDDGASIWDATIAASDVIPPGEYTASTARGEIVSLDATIGYESTQGTWTLLVEDFDEEDSGAISGWSITTRSVPVPDCDFNSDGHCDVEDLDGPMGLYSFGDLEVGVAVDPAANARYNILQDGRIDVGDLNLWRGAAARHNGFAQAYRKSDLDLDAVVGFSDFLNLSASFGNGRLWSEGNSRGAGETDFADFLLLSADFGRELQQLTLPASNVPEPAANGLLFFGVLGVLFFRRRDELGKMK